MSVVQRRKAQMYFAVAAGLGLAGAAQAATFTWNGAGEDANWTNPANWTANSGFPASGDLVQWSGGSTPDNSTVDLSANATASDLNVNNKAVQFNLNNFTLSFDGALASPYDVQGDAGSVTFAGPGSVTFTGQVLRLGFEGTGLRNVVNASGGAQVSTSSGINIGDYRNGGEINVDGAGTVWNSSGAVQFGRAGSSSIFTQPRAVLSITNGGVFNHNTESTFTVSRNDHSNSEITVDGPGSQLNFTGTSGSNVIIGGYGANTTWNVTNGGLLSSTASLGLGFAGGTGVNTFNISGGGAKFLVPIVTLAGRSGSDFNRNPTVVNIGEGGILETTSADGGDRSINVGDRGRLVLQGGTIITPAGKHVALRQGSVADAQATLEGFGTIVGGNLRVEGDSIVRPGGAGATGTIVIENGNLAVLATEAQLLFDLSTDASAAHDSIVLQSAGSSANIAGLLSFTNLAVGSGAQAAGILDFIVADTIAYNTGTDGLNLSSGDIPLDADNLDSLLQAEGYVRVFGTPVNLGEYRYYIANDVLEDSAGGLTLDALRLEIAPIPEPGALSLLAMGGLLMLRRRRA